MTKDEALKLALVIDEFDGNDESLPLELLKPIAETLRALAQPNHIVDANKMAQPAQEPVAWMHEWEDGERVPQLHPSDDRLNDPPTSVRPLVYGDTAPPQRPWVGLTGQEKALIASVSKDVPDAIYRANAKLKELNT